MSEIEISLYILSFQQKINYTVSFDDILGSNFEIIIEKYIFNKTDLYVPSSEWNDALQNGVWRCGSDHSRQILQ